MKIGLGIGIGAGGGAAPWTPLALGSSLALWLRADLGVTLNGATVSAWADQSGNGRHATQGTEALQPARLAAGHARSVGGQAVIDFDGTNDSLGFGASAFSALTSGAEVFIVGRLDADPPAVFGKTGFWVFGAGPDSIPYTDGVLYDSFATTARKTTVNPSASMASPFVYGVKSVSGEWTSRLNGTQIFTTATNTVGWPAAPVLGATGGQFMDGVVAEMIVADHTVTAAQRTAVHQYLAARYGITVA